MKKKMAEQKDKLPGVIGLAFVSPDAIKVILNRSEWVAELCPSEHFAEWVKSDHDGRKTVALLTDKAKFQDALASNVDAIVAFCPWTWLRGRGILCLDAKERGEGLVVHKDTNPDAFHSALNAATPYKKSANDIWISKGKPKPDPTRDSMPAAKLYRTYSLANLLHMALSRADEDLMLVPPKDFWEATYQFANGKMTRKNWLARFGRAMKTAGIPRQDIKNISLWIKRYGKHVASREIVSPVSTLDIKYGKLFASS